MLDVGRGDQRTTTVAGVQGSVCLDELSSPKARDATALHASILR